MISPKLNFLVLHGNSVVKETLNFCPHNVLTELRTKNLGPFLPPCNWEYSLYN